MILKKGNMFDEWGKCSVLLVTTNAFIKQNGELVMGRGAALQLKQKVPESALELGSSIPLRAVYNYFVESPPYGVVLADQRTSLALHGQVYGAFQVKRHFRESASLDLIRHSAKQLASWLQEPYAQQDWWVMNFPGIGYGNLDRRDVLPVLEEEFEGLPNLAVYEYE